MDEIVKTYTNGEITIVWKPALCIHSTICWKGKDGLIDVFNPRERPWVKPLGASSERIAAQVDKCPSGALSYYANEGAKEETKGEELMAEIIPNGPLVLHGNITITGAGGSNTNKTGATAFCRCGASASKPYCDGSHVRTGFRG